MRENHFFILFVKIIIFVFSFVFVFYNLGNYINKSQKYKDPISYVAQADLISEKPVMKTSLIERYFSLGKVAEPQQKVTNKIIDFDEGQIWVTEAQAEILSTIYVASFIPAFIFFVMGIDGVYLFIRNTANKVTRALADAFFPLALFGVLLWIGVYFVCILTFPITYPVSLVVHLILGFVQLIGRIRPAPSSYAATYSGYGGPSAFAQPQEPPEDKLVPTSFGDINFEDSALKDLNKEIIADNTEDDNGGTSA